MEKHELIAFEAEVAKAFEEKRIPGPIHLSGGNEDVLIAFFSAHVKREDWVLSTWRNRYHALLHGVPKEVIWENLLAGRSMNLRLPTYRFLTSAIAGGIAPIAVGLAKAGRRVHCFIGDMTARMGVVMEARRYAANHELPVTFYVEDNGMSTDSPTREVWGDHKDEAFYEYRYTRTHPHMGIGKWVQF